jgi:hypothetical protein
MWPTLPPGLRGNRPTNSSWAFDFMATVSSPDMNSVLASTYWEQATSRAILPIGLICVAIAGSDEPTGCGFAALG